MYLGIDFTDEALYSAIPYRFVLGDVPFVDEWNLTQGVSLLVYPFYRAYVFLLGSTDGILLFGRHLVFVFALGVGAVLYRFTREALYPEQGILAAVFPAVFVPYNLYGPSYNAAGSGLFLLGLCLAWAPFHRSRRLAFASGLAHALACFAYPTLALPCVAFLAYLFVTSRRRTAVPLTYLAGGLLATLVLVLAYGIRPANVQSTLGYVFEVGKLSDHEWEVGKLGKLLSAFWARISYKALLAGLLLGLVVAVRKKWSAAVVVIGWALPVFFFFANRAVLGGHGIMGELRYLACLAPLLYLLIERRPTDLPLLAGVWFPACVGGATVAWSSNMGIEAAPVMMAGALVVSMHFLARMVSQGLARLHWPHSLSMVPWFTVFATIVYAKAPVYMDFPMKELTVRMDSGPFKGLFTTPQRADFLRRLDRDLEKQEAGMKFVLFQPHFPGGYLMTALKPAAPSVWGTCPQEISERCALYYRSHVDGPALAVSMLKFEMYPERTDTFVLPTDNAMERLVKDEMIIAAKDSYYEIYSTRPNAIRVSPSSVR